MDELHRRRGEHESSGEKAKQRHMAAGKLLPRDRIDVLLDPGSPFMELGDLAGVDMYDGVPPGAGIITGIGQVKGVSCMIIANDAPVKGGTYFAMTAKKHVRAQKIAWQHRLPNITLVDSGGANLPEQPGIFPDSGQYGSVFNQIVRQSAEGIPQIAVVHGACTAGGAYVPALCDLAVIVREQGYMHLGGPELTYAATGEEVDRETLGGALMHSETSGVTDYLVENDRHAMATVRNLVGDTCRRPSLERPVRAPKPPRYDP
ncbi:MAG: methylcrotonoyl-CoA carboxylase, partial [Rhodospirillaceae bacterium]|nr:methylcrotonoyl-CoA carboxylase [Rhodospirillaceae bacterium]